MGQTFTFVPSCSQWQSVGRLGYSLIQLLTQLLLMLPHRLQLLPLLFSHACTDMGNVFLAEMGIAATLGAQRHTTLS